MTKRLLALFLVCILAIPIFAVPASATSYPIVNGNYGAATGDQDFDNWINLRNIANLLGNISDNVLQATNNYLRSIQSHIEVWSASWADTMSTLFDSLELMIGWQEIQTEAQNSILAWNEDIWAALDTINTNFIKFAGVMETAHNNILDSVNGFWDGFLLWWEDFNTFTANVNTKFTSLINGLFHVQTGWLPRIATQLGNLINGLTSQKQEADEFADQVSTESTEFQENMDAIDEWTRPDYEADFDPSLEGINGGHDTAIYTDYLGQLFKNSALFTTLLFMAFSFSAISFVVFGKR